MSQNNKNIISESQTEQNDTVFTPGDDLQVVMQGGFPVSIIVPIEEFDRMAATIALAEELLEGKDLFLEDGTKVTFQEMADQRVAQERAAYEAELSSMMQDEDDGEECDEDCGQDCAQDEQD